MTGAPLVSIVVPVFNGERHLAESLDSILAQTYPNLEVLVLDDASTDGTAEVVAGYGDRVAYHRQATTRGIYGNANVGIQLARGEYVAVYHGDDVYLPEIVEREVEYLEAHPQVGAVFCKDVFVDSANVEIGRLELPPEVRGSLPLDHRTVLNALLTYKNAFLRCPSAMVRASVHQEVGVYRDDEFKNTSDLEMWLRIARRYPIAVLDEYLMRYRRGHGSSSERYHKVRTEPERFFRILDLALAHSGRPLADPSALAAFEAHRASDLLMIAVSHYILGDRAEARRGLERVSARALFGSGRIERWRLGLLLAGMWVLVRLPSIPPLGRFFYRRWHDHERKAMSRPRVRLEETCSKP